MGKAHHWISRGDDRSDAAFPRRNDAIDFTAGITKPRPPRRRIANALHLVKFFDSHFTIPLRLAAATTAERTFFCEERLSAAVYGHERTYEPKSCSPSGRAIHSKVCRHSESTESHPLNSTFGTSRVQLSTTGHPAPFPSVNRSAVLQQHTGVFC